MRILLYLAVSLFSVMTLFGFAHAHGLGGGIDKVVDGYLIDFGYSPEELVSGANIQFTAGLVDNESKEIADFENVWVRISKANRVLFASTLEKSMSQDASFLYNFSEPGIYEITVRFQKFNEEVPETRLAETIVETSFDVNIAGAAAERKSRVSGGLIIGFISGAILGIIISLILRRKVK